MSDKERPILFSGPMVRAILDGKKTQTRRVVTHVAAIGTPSTWCETAVKNPAAFEKIAGDYRRFSPYGTVGGRLWVRETMYIDAIPYDRGPLPKTRPGDLDVDTLYFRADGECCEQIPECCCAEIGRVPWRPSIHMPRWASRITLEIESVRVERLQSMGEVDAIAEGVDPLVDATQPDPWAQTNFLGAYELLWDAINGERNGGAYKWRYNPWVWVISFRRIEALPLAPPQSAVSDLSVQD